MHVVFRKVFFSQGDEMVRKGFNGYSISFYAWGTVESLIKPIDFKAGPSGRGSKGKRVYVFR
jgi:hypothetical protein